MNRIKHPHRATAIIYSTNMNRVVAARSLRIASGFCVLGVSCLACVALAAFAMISRAGRAQTSRHNDAAPVATQPSADTPNNPSSSLLLETGDFAAKNRNDAGAPAELKIVTYNIRWRGGEELRRLIEALKTDQEIGGAHIIGLQEVDRNRKRTNNENTARLIAETLHMNYAWAAPPTVDTGEDAEEETGVAILSVFPLKDVERFVLPNAGPGGRRRAGIGATVQVGERDVRFYSLHAETRIPKDRKIEQLAHILENLKQYPTSTRAICVGDFNTIKDKDQKGTIDLFNGDNFTTPFPHDEHTWKQYFIKLKLDWMWLRGLTAVDHKIVRSITFSDHYPLVAKVRFD